MIYESVTSKKWQSHKIDERAVYRIINDYNLSDLLSRIIYNRGIDYEDIPNYIDPKIKNLLPDPFHLLDMDKATKIVGKAILNNRKIAVIGDYDVDGATSSALLKKLFQNLDIECEIYIPDRDKEGYGPSKLAIDNLISKNVELIITVDCGINAFEEVEYAKSKNLDFVILDHHISEFQLPNADAIVNPNRFDETTNLKNLAAVGVCFLFAIALNSHLREHDFFKNKNEPDLIKLLDLVALGTVCDMMTLQGLNRAFVSQGLKIMSRRENIGLSTLSDTSNIDSKISTYHLGFVLGPRINAGGRVGKSYLGSNLLSTNDQNLAAIYSDELEEFNNQRKIIENNVLIEALDQVQNKLHNEFLILHSKDWHQGVIGIVAGKLKDKYNKPVAVISDIEGEGKASCRSIKGIDLGAIIVDCKNNDLILGGGGHAMAAGFSVNMSKIDDLQNFLNERCKKLSSKIEENISKYDFELTSDAVNMDLANEILKLEPFGNGNKEPIFKINNLFVLKANVSANKHVSCLLAPDRNTYGKKAIRAIAFNVFESPIGDMLLSEKAKQFDIIGNIKINNWQGNTNIQLNILDIIPREV